MHGSLYFFDRNEDLAWPSAIQTPGTRIPAAFAKPAAGSFGNLGRDAIYGPGLASVDYSMFKNFPLWKERIKGQFRVEIFNLFNRTNWAPPTATLTSASFGEMTATRNAASAPGLGFGEPRNIQLAMKIIY